MTEVLQATAPHTMMPQFEPDVPGRMTQISQFAFPSRPADDREGNRLPSASTLEPLAIPASRSHRRARTSVNVTPPLPSFSFGGSSSESSPAMSTPSSFQSTTDHSSLASTPTTRHRRAVSEYIGDKPEMDRTTEQSATSLPAPSSSSTPAKAHRHRRSGAVSSQDLSSLRTPLITGPDAHQDSLLRSGNNGHEAGGDGTLTPIAEMASPQTQNDPESPARSVSFSDVVIRHDPRPMSVVSYESGSSQSTIRDTRSTPTENWSNPMTQSSSTGHLSSTFPDGTDDSFLSSAPDDGPGTGIDIVELDENFDHDPTEAVVNDSMQDPYLPYPEESMQEPRLSPSKSKLMSDNEPAVPEIDLDFASLDRPVTPPRPTPRGSGFQKARASMHSAGSSSGALASTFVSHRRTESAPSLSASPFLPRENAAEAGFEMTDVFEEDEEDEDAEKTPEQKPFSEIQSDLMAVTSDDDQTPKPLAGKRDTHSSPSLLPPFQFSLTNFTSHDDAELDRRSPDTPVSLPRPPFASYDDYSASNKSSPKYAQSSFSSCEPSPSTFHHSVDDVPSLISGGSTVGDATLADPSIKSLDPGFGIAGSTSSLAPSTTRRHRKRLSVMSMSMSMPRLFTSNSAMSDDPRPGTSSRSQSTADMTTPKPPRSQRLRQRIFSMFKKTS